MAASPRVRGRFKKDLPMPPASTVFPHLRMYYATAKGIVTTNARLFRHSEAVVGLFLQNMDPVAQLVEQRPFKP